MAKNAKATNQKMTVTTMKSFMELSLPSAMRRGPRKSPRDTPEVPRKYPLEYPGSPARGVRAIGWNGEPNMKRHWEPKDFVVTSTSPAYDGSAAVNRFGYCAVCKADMASFGGDGPIRHYHSHKETRKLGLWGVKLA